MRKFLGMVLAASMTTAASAQTPDLARFRDIYKELIETNTTFSSGDCTLLAQRMAARLKQAGYRDSDLHILVADGHPKQGSLVAVLPGTDPKAKGILLLGHIDVVEAKREDWTRDPFTLIEEGGYFYGRGTADMKGQVAAWVDAMIRLKEQKVRNLRPVKMALTCGEEGGTLNGAKWLMENRRALVDADFALNEGGGGMLDENGNRVALHISSGEKLYRNYQVEVLNPGGHSARPVKDNAIVRLGQALARINQFDFPVETSDASRKYFERMALLEKGELGAVMAAFARNPSDARAATVLARDPTINAMMRTTCVVTMIDGGHARNALPQRATANINCRLFPGGDTEATRAKLQEIAADSQVRVTAAPDKVVDTPAISLTGAITDPIERLAAKTWPGVPLIPRLTIQGSDSAHLIAAGIPSYGFSAIFQEPGDNGVHGLNERVRVRSLYEARQFLFELVKAYATRK